MVINNTDWIHFELVKINIKIKNQCILMKKVLWEIIINLLSFIMRALQKNNSRCHVKWAASWQNQQCGCAPSEDSDQPGHPPSLIGVFTVRMRKAWVLSYPLSAQRRLIRLGRCPGWSESSLGAHPLCWFCHEAAKMSILKKAFSFMKWKSYIYRVLTLTPYEYPRLSTNRWRPRWLPLSKKAKCKGLSSRIV